MRSMFAIGLCFALLLVLSEAFENKQFCEAFAENGYKISYLYRYNVKTREGMNYVLIGQNYWLLKYIDDNDDNKKIVTLTREGNYSSDWFGDQYSLGFCIRKDDDHCTTGLMKKLQLSRAKVKNEIIWKNIDSDKMISKTQIDMNFNPITGFVPGILQDYYRVVAFYVQFPSPQYEIFIFDHKFDAKGGNEWKKFVPKELQNEAIPTALLDLRKETKLLSVVVQYAKSVDKRLLIIFFAAYKAITYCVTDPQDLNELCKSNLKVFRDCSYYDSPTTPTTPVPKVEKSGNALTVVMIVVFIVIILALVPAIAWFAYNYMNKKSAIEGPASSVTQPTVKSDVQPTVKSGVEPTAKSGVQPTAKSDVQSNTKPLISSKIFGPKKP